MTGLIDVFDTRPRDYAEHQDYLRVVGRVVAAVVEAALLVDDLDEGPRGWTSSQDVQRPRALECRREVARVAARRVARACDADACTLYWIPREQPGHLVTVLDGADGRVVRELVVDELPGARAALELHAPVAVAARGGRVTALSGSPDPDEDAWVPLVAGDRTVGMLHVRGLREPKPADYPTLLADLAGVLAKTLERTRLTELLAEGADRESHQGDS